MKPKYVVIVEADSGYMECAGVCDSYEEACGRAYLSLIDGLKQEAYTVSLPEPREGENGDVIEVIDKETGKAVFSATVLVYKED